MVYWRVILAALIIAVSAEAVNAQQTKYIYYLPVILKTMPSKRGIASLPTDDSCGDVDTLQADWYYNWLPYTWPPGCGPDPRFVPTVWDETVNLDDAINHARPSGWLIGFNEPDRVEQANMLPVEGAVLWRIIEAKAAPYNIKLVSPTPSQHDPFWLKRMILEYKAIYNEAPRFDAIGVHAYFSDPAEMQAYITARHNEFPDLPIWVTEFSGCLVYPENPAGIMSNIVPWMERTPWIDRYAWFVSRWGNHQDTHNSCALMDTSGRLTTSGKNWVDLSQ